tara:strand:+ start:62790 stop:63575 length:786 start_codon:yes stop_codon:yes gene_type:complete
MPLPEIDPIIFSIGPLAIRWYGITWLLAFSVIYYLLKRKQLFTPEQVSDLMFYGLLSSIIGGRLGYMIFYGTDQLLSNPLSLFYIWQGGLSFHGGLIGVLVSCYLMAQKLNITFFGLMDIIALCIPPGLGLVRIGNFLNSELHGRPTDVSWGVIYANDPLGVIRHPSQLYQAFLEGIVLYLILMFLSQLKKPEKFISGSFLLGYGLLRIFSEFFREPDPHLGLVGFDLLSQGQMLSIPMIAIGLFLIYYSFKIRGNNETIS